MKRILGSLLIRQSTGFRRDSFEETVLTECYSDQFTSFFIARGFRTEALILEKHRVALTDKSDRKTRC